MDMIQAKRIVEAILFVFGGPVALKRVQEAVPEVDVAVIRQAVQELNAEYAAARRAFQVQEVLATEQEQGLV